MKSILTSILILFSVRVISQKAQMEILGALGNQTTVLTIGSDGTGISLQRNWPTIGFNQYRDAQNLQRFMGDGYAGSIFFSPVEGGIYFSQFNDGSQDGFIDFVRIPFYITGIGNVNVMQNLGIGNTSTGSYKVKITHSTYGFNIENASTLDDWEFWSNSSGLAMYCNGNFRGQFDPNSGVYAAASDLRLKQNIAEMPDVLSRVRGLKAREYQFKSDTASTSARHFGFLAQEVQPVFPSLVKHIVEPERDLEVYAVDYAGFGVVAIKAIQELVEKIVSLENRIYELETQSLKAKTLKSD
ncbi:MAG: tail fiber domain-containing protein [Saprospiraceae bacterium]|nr:tail fiber domain-containing protein [Saprospiraceae bacterium]